MINVINQHRKQKNKHIRWHSNMFIVQQGHVVDPNELTMINTCFWTASWDLTALVHDLQCNCGDPTIDFPKLERKKKRSHEGTIITGMMLQKIGISMSYHGQ